MDFIIIDDYKIYLNKILGRGSFGCICLTENIINKKNYATKIEKKTVKHSQLSNEINILKKHPKYINIYFTHSDNENNYFIMDLFGSNLTNIIKKYGIFDMKNTLNIALIILKQIRYYHSNNIIHRDIKPNNIVHYSNTVILIDFGLAINLNDYQKPNKYFGTARYMSLNAMEKKPQSFIDDLYSFGYVVLFLLYGSLFWFDIDYTDTADRNKKIYKLKSAITNYDLVKQFKCSDLCQNCLATKNMEKYFNYLDEIKKNNNTIDYDYIVSLFQSIITTHLSSDGVKNLIN